MTKKETADGAGDYVVHRTLLRKIPNHVEVVGDFDVFIGDCLLRKFSCGLPKDRIDDLR